MSYLCLCGGVVGRYGLAVGDWRMLAMRCHSVWFLLLREDRVMGGVLYKVLRPCILVLVLTMLLT